MSNPEQQKQDQNQHEHSAPHKEQPRYLAQSSNGEARGWEDFFTCKIPGDSGQQALPRLRKKNTFRNESLKAVICSWTVEHQVGLSINLVLLHALTHLCFPRARQSTRKFYQLSHYNPATGKYAAGWDDLYMIVYSIIVLTGLRAGILDYLLMPLAQFAGINKKKDKVRFAEQAWVLIYDSVFWVLGMWIMYNHEHWLSMEGMWTNWPSREIKGSMKWYYLVQFSFWLQQIVIVNIEERRKDHWQMFSHHIITCILMVTSYGYHQTKSGNMILCLMDVVDIFLALAKVLKYLKFQLACDIAFGVFMLVWFLTRHVLYLRVAWSLYHESPNIIRHGCYSGGTEDLKGPFPVPDGYRHLMEPFQDPEGVVCWNDNIKWGFVYTLMALQVLLLLWFGMIIRVAAKVLRGGEADDSRSDDEDDYEVKDTQETANGRLAKYQKHSVLPPLEEEVGVEEISIRSQRSSPVRRYRKGGGVASGVTLHSDRKELLGRIGCDGGHE